MLKTNREPNLTMVNKRLACLYDEEIKDVEDDIQNEENWAIASTTDWERDMYLQNVADEQAYLEKLKELRAKTMIGGDNMTREMIKNGFSNGVISIEDKYAGCITLCCRIGEYAFYFIGGDILTKDEFWKSYTLDEAVDMLYDILKTAKSAEENGLEDGEYGYYVAVLSA